MKINYKIIAVAGLLGLSAAVIDAFLDRIYFYRGQGTFLDLLVSNVPQHEFYIRSVIFVLFILFGVIVSRVVAKRMRVEEALQKAKEDLEARVKERTDQLRKASEKAYHQLHECMHAEEALRESEAQLRALSSKLLTTQEEERKRISRELHDELGQALAFLKIRLRSIQNHLPADQAKVREECIQDIQYVDQIIESVRRFSRDLSPSILEDLGLSSALRWLIHSFKETYRIEISSDIADMDHLFSQDKQIVIYRIFQEALTNIGKHARAGQVSLTARRQNGLVSFSIADDGAGFSLKETMARDFPAKGLGLATMHERARMLGIPLDLTSEAGKGTCIRFSIPLRGDEASHEVGFLSNPPGR